MKRTIGLLAVILATLFTVSACRAPEGQNFGTQAAAVVNTRDLRVLFVADPHIDPFRDPALVRKLERAPVTQWPALMQTVANAPFATVGRDSNPSLLISAVQAMQQDVPDPDVVLVAGDLLGHDFRQHFLDTAHDKDDAAYHRFVDKTAEVVPLVLHAVYPKAQMLPTVGNNDGYCGDYESTPRDAFLRHETAAWQPMVNRAGRAPDFMADYARGGFYEARLANGVRILSLNSIVFSDKYENACGDPADKPAVDELAWLKNRVSAAHAPPTIVLTHIPPGIDAFKTFLHLGKPNVFYHADSQRAVISLLDAPSAHVTTVLTGHLHNVGYRIVSRAPTKSGSDGIPVFSGPSISPIFGNAPAFAELDISASGVVDNITVYELRTGVPGLKTGHPWFQAYDFNQRYNVRGLTTASIRALHAREQSDIAFRETVERDRVSGGPATALGQLQWRTAWCAEVALDATAYLRCEGFQR